VLTQAFKIAFRRRRAAFDRRTLGRRVQIKRRRFGAAFNVLTKARDLAPDEPAIRVNLARALTMMERFDEAVAELDAADDGAETRSPLGFETRLEILYAGDKERDADDLLDTVASAPDADPALLCVAARLMAFRDRHDDAEVYLRRALDVAPDDIETLRAFAAHSEIRGRFGEAVRALLRATGIDADNADLWASLAGLMAARAKPALNRARAAAEKAMALSEGTEELSRGQALIALAGVEKEEGNFDEAEKLFREAWEMFPEFAPASLGLGHMFMLLGRIDEAVELFEQASKLAPVAGFNALVQARAAPDDPRKLKRIERLARRPSLAGSVRGPILFNLARAWEKRGDYKRAFERVKDANEASRRHLDYDASENRAAISRIMDVFTPAFFEARASFGSPSRLPVFIVGMPRSGTTLTEQIIASHPKAFGAGELGHIASYAHGLSMAERHFRTGRGFPECVDRLSAGTSRLGAEHHLRELKGFDSKAERVTDKLPHNFTKVGLIHLLFPDAAIIHCRREVRDTAVSNFFADYQAKFAGMGFAYDLADLGKHLVDYQRLMSHWHDVLPGRILDIDYEETVEDPEAVARRILDHVGLEWDESVLDFHKLDRPVKTASVWQVRQPIYTTSKEKWRRYEEFLGPLEDALAAGFDEAAE